MLWTGKDLGRVVAAALKEDLDIHRGVAVFEAYYSFQQVADQFQEVISLWILHLSHF